MGYVCLLKFHILQLSEYFIAARSNWCLMVSGLYACIIFLLIQISVFFFTLKYQINQIPTNCLKIKSIKQAFVIYKFIDFLRQTNASTYVYGTVHVAKPSRTPIYRIISTDEPANHQNKTWEPCQLICWSYSVVFPVCMVDWCVSKFNMTRTITRKNKL